MPNKGDWVGIGKDLVIGGVAGAVDQFVQNKDDERASSKTAPETLALWSQYSTYVNYGLPIVDVLAVGMGWLTGEWADKLTTISGQLLGRKLMHKFQNEKHLAGYPGSDNKWVMAPVPFRAANAAELARLKAAQDKARQAGKEIPVMTGRSVLEI